MTNSSVGFPQFYQIQQILDRFLNRLCPLNLSIEIKLRVLKSKKLFLINHRTIKEKCQDISIEKRKKISIKMVFLKDG
ncbi:hypothetical protein ATW67_10215 [Oenococcus oeni]|nr:hypothetical protein ATW67_10215 [Oenococcus oeni]